MVVVSRRNQRDHIISSASWIDSKGLPRLVLLQNSCLYSRFNEGKRKELQSFGSCRDSCSIRWLGFRQGKAKTERCTFEIMLGDVMPQPSTSDTEYIKRHLRQPATASQDITRSLYDRLRSDSTES